MRTQVAIVGAGPAGALLAYLLHRVGVSSVVLECQTREHVLGRIRAGVLEWSSVELLRATGLGDRMDREGRVHDDIKLGWHGENVLTIDLRARAGMPMMAYGQTLLQEDLYRALDDADVDMRFEAGDVALHDLHAELPSVTFVRGGDVERIECDFVAGCDGFHGVSRATIPETERREFVKAYPFGWLGILSATPPLSHLIYVNHERGFALCSQRNAMLSRYYVQCPLEESLDDWPDDRFWSELLARVPPVEGERIVTGPSIEKSITPLRSYVVEPLRWGRLFLAGDAAHIVPPTGAKGLNVAISDVHYLSQALASHYGGDGGPLVSYSDTALRRVWGAVRFSWWLTRLMHRFPDQSAFDQRAQEEELRYLASSPAAQTSLAEQYVGLPL